MQSPSFPKAVALVCLIGLSLPLACSDDEDAKPGGGGTGNNAGQGGASGGGRAGNSNAGRGGGSSGSGGSGGAALPDGLSTMPSTKECENAANACESAQAVTVFVDPCCTADGGCGLSTTFLALVGAQFSESCQAREQPGVEDESCPAATGLQVPAGAIMLDLDPLPGCCREDGKCGVVVDEVTASDGRIPIAQFGLGCIEGAPFFDNKATSCGDGAGGAGGAGAGGAGPGGAGFGGAGGDAAGAGGQPIDTGSGGAP